MEKATAATAKGLALAANGLVLRWIRPERGDSDRAPLSAHRSAGRRGQPWAGCGYIATAPAAAPGGSWGKGDDRIGVRTMIRCPPQHGQASAGRGLTQAPAGAGTALRRSRRRSSNRLRRRRSHGRPADYADTGKSGAEGRSCTPGCFARRLDGGIPTAR